MSQLDMLAQNFEEAFSAPSGIKRLRELILTLAMQGKLVEQDPAEGSADELLRDIEAEKGRLVAEGKIKAPKPLPPIEPEEVPYELPQGWRWVRLGEISTYIQRGKGPKYVDVRVIPVISQKCVQWRGFDKDAVKFIDPESLKSYGGERLIRFGDILWNSTGTGTIGRVNLYRDELAGFAAVVADSHVTVVRTIGIDHDYALRFLSAPFVQDDIEGSASGTTNQIELNTSTVVNQLIALPPLAEQRRIVARIDQLMARCDELEALRAVQEQKRVQVQQAILREITADNDHAAFAENWQFLADHFGELHATPQDVAGLRSAVLQLAVMGKLVPQDVAEGTAQELLAQIEQEKRRLVAEGKIKAPKHLPSVSEAEQPYQVPQGWAWVQMMGLCTEITSGSTPPNHVFSEFQGIPYLKVYNIRDQKIDFDYKPQYIPRSFHEKELRKSRLFPGDVIMNIVGPPLGKTAIIPDEYDEYNCNQAIVFFRPVLKEINTYLYTYLLSGEFLKRIELIGTAGQDNISVSKSRDMLIPLPPLAEQRRIVAKVDSLMALCDGLEARLRERTAKQGELLGAVMAELAPTITARPVAVSRARAAGPGGGAAPSGRGRPRKVAAEGAQGAGQQADEKRSRGRPRKDGAEPKRSILEASSVEDAIRRLEAQKLERAQGERMVGLFED